MPLVDVLGPPQRLAETTYLHQQVVKPIHTSVLITAVRDLLIQGKQQYSSTEHMAPAGSTQLESLKVDFVTGKWGFKACLIVSRPR
jgi:hypothetical protein